VNSVNASGSLSTAIVPPCCWGHDVIADREAKSGPSPVGLVVKNGWKQLVPDLGGIPTPLSRTRISNGLAEIARRHGQDGRNDESPFSRARLVAA